LYCRREGERFAVLSAPPKEVHTTAVFATITMSSDEDSGNSTDSSVDDLGPFWSTAVDFMERKEYEFAVNDFFKCLEANPEDEDIA
jgi:hypothetical protein